jgi:hypothetical protein
LERCLDEASCPVDQISKSNLKFLIGLRHEVEHQMTTKIDEYLSARFQACCLNYNLYVKQLFGKECGIDQYLSFSLQFSTIKEEHMPSIVRKKLNIDTSCRAVKKIYRLTCKYFCLY